MLSVCKANTFTTWLLGDPSFFFPFFFSFLVLNVLLAVSAYLFLSVELVGTSENKTYFLRTFGSVWLCGWVHVQVCVLER